MQNDASLQILQMFKQIGGCAIALKTTPNAVFVQWHTTTFLHKFENLDEQISRKTELINTGTKINRKYDSSINYLGN